MESKRELAYVGTFVLIAGAILFITVLALSGAWGRSGTTYRATFRFRTMADADEFFALIGRDKRTVVFWPEDWDPAQRQFSGEGKPKVVADATA